MENRAVKHLTDLMGDLTSAQKKQIRPDPIALAKKWGDDTLAMSKKIKELEDLAASMNATLVGLSASMKSINAVLPKDQQKESELTLKLLNAVNVEMRTKWLARMDVIKPTTKI